MKQQVAESRTIKLNTLRQSKLTERAVSDAVKATKHDVEQKQRLSELENINQRRQEQVEKLESQNAAWAERFLEEMMGRKTDSEEKEVQLADARRITQDCEIEMAAVDLVGRNQAKELCRLHTEVRDLTERLKGKEEDIYYSEMRGDIHKELLQEVQVDAGKQKVQLNRMKSACEDWKKQERILRAEIAEKEREIQRVSNADRTKYQELMRYKRQEERKNGEEALKSKRKSNGSEGEVKRLKKMTR